MVRILALDLAASIPAAPARADNATFGKFRDTLRAAAKTPARCADHGGRVYVTPGRLLLRARRSRATRRRGTSSATATPAA